MRAAAQACTQDLQPDTGNSNGGGVGRADFACALEIIVDGLLFLPNCA